MQTKNNNEKKKKQKQENTEKTYKANKIRLKWVI